MRDTYMLAHTSLRNSPYLLPLVLSSTALQLAHTSSGGGGGGGGRGGGDMR